MIKICTILNVCGEQESTVSICEESIYKRRCLCEMTGSTQPRRDAAAKTITDSIPGKKMTCGILPPPASWPATKHGDQQQHLLSARSAVLMGAERAITANIHNDGFDEEMKVNVPGREANFMVRVAGRELASTGGIVMALHGVS